mmetsp:Transcript_2866/g.5222  ORF Transcript_2866/g.5222 Transcript_2866/m.5222 type:complete len:175 (-) Transcript_2866:476-1000(-)
MVVAVMAAGMACKAWAEEADTGLIVRDIVVAACAEGVMGMINRFLWHRMVATVEDMEWEEDTDAREWADVEVTEVDTAAWGDTEEADTAAWADTEEVDTGAWVDMEAANTEAWVVAATEVTEDRWEATEEADMEAMECREWAVTAAAAMEVDMVVVVDTAEAEAEAVMASVTRT